MTKRSWMTWLWRYLGSGPTHDEIDDDLMRLDAKLQALDENSPLREDSMSNGENELQLTPPPSTPDSPRRISVYQLSDEEWWAGETLQACIDAAADSWGYGADEKAKMFDDAVEVTEKAMDRLMFCYDEDDWSKKHSFRTELDMQVADPHNKFPKFFASTEW